MNNRYFVAFILMISVCGALSAQYTDHRNRHVDSLEQVLATDEPTSDELVRAYRELAWGYLQTDKEKSMNYARKCIDISVPLEKWNFVSNCYRLLGMHFYAFSQYDSAIIYYEKALDAVERMRNYPKQFEENHIDDLFSSVYGSIGNLCNIQGKNHEAIEYYIKALRIFEKHGWKESQANAYYNIGEMYLNMNNYEQAEINYTKLDAVAHELNDTMFRALATLGLSVAFLHQMDFGKALENANTAHGYFFAHPEEVTLKVSNLNVLAEIYLNGYNDDHRAEGYVRQALQIADSIEIVPIEKSATLRCLSAIYLRRNEWRQAEQTALKALATDDSKPANTLALYEILAKSYAYLGKAAQADEYIVKMRELQSTWSNKNYQSAIRDMEVKYETEKKETQIATLETENRLLAAQKRLFISLGIVVLLLILAALFLTVQKRRLAEQKIKQLEQEKRLIATQAVLDGEVQERTRLARDLHDGLGSMLAAVKVNMQNAKPELNGEGVYYGKAVGLLDDSMKELRRLAHHLMPEALMQYGLKNSLQVFCQSMPNVRFHYFGNDVRFDGKIETLMYRSAHELIYNAVKHADAPHINVQLVQEPDRISLTVQDDGIGFDPVQATGGMGLTNIRQRVAAFNGEFNISSEPGKGTEISMEFVIYNS